MAKNSRAFWCRIFVIGIATFGFISPFQPAKADGDDGSALIFSFDESSVSQAVAVDTSGKTTLTASARARNTQYGPDRFLLAIHLKGPGGGGIYSHSTGWIELTSSYQDITLTISADGVGAEGWAEAVTAEIVLAGDDSEFWAGNYGPSVESASLTLDAQELLSNTQFASTSGWTSSIGWQECHATVGNQPCVSVASPPSTTTSSTSTTTTTTLPVSSGSIYGTANEGWNLTLTAPFGVFTAVEFASYGTPNNETLGSCHASNSIQKVSEVFLGESSATIAASNSVFGDPCGGTYKRLNVRLTYSGVAPPTTTTTTTTTTPPSCGPYEPQTVTGQSDGALWGSNPYTDDSNFGAAVVHAGLAAIGETVIIEPYDVSYYTSYSASVANGVTSYDWSSGWCGYRIRIAGSAATTTTTTTTTTTEAPQPTTLPPAPVETTPPPIIIEPGDDSTGDTNTENGGTDDQGPDQEVDDGGTVDDAPADPAEPEAEVPESAPDQENEEPSEEAPLTPEPDPTPEPQPDPSVDPEPSPEPDAPEDDATNDDSLSESVEEALSEDATEEEIAAAVDEAISDGLSSNDAAALAESAAVLASISGEQATEIFSAIEVSELSDEELAQVVTAVQDAPTEVREAFEEEINVFGGGALDEYVPIGSVISVGERRVVIAATGVMLAGVPMPSRAPSAPAGGIPSGPSGATTSSSSSSENRSRKPGR